jgi:hypothetical protein
MQFKRQKHENFRKKIFGMELVLCMTPIFRPVSHFLFADGREHPCLMDTFIFYLYLLTVNLIIRRGYLEKSPIAVLKLTTAGLLFLT